MNNIDTTFISLITLTTLIVSSLAWLVLRTLKEGRKALTEVKMIDHNNHKKNSKI